MHYRGRSVFDLGEWNVAGLQFLHHGFGENAGLDEPTPTATSVRAIWVTSSWPIKQHQTHEGAIRFTLDFCAGRTWRMLLI